MPIFVLDAGALISIDRGNRDLLSTLLAAFESGNEVQVPAGAIGQVWQDPNRHVLLSRVLKRCEEIPLDGLIARSSGYLCGQAGTSDVINASVAVAVAESRSRHNRVILLTSDVRDMGNLLSALHTNAEIVKV